MWLNEDERAYMERAEEEEAYDQQRLLPYCLTTDERVELEHGVVPARVEQRFAADQRPARALTASRSGTVQSGS